MPSPVGKTTQATPGVHSGTLAVLNLLQGQVDPHQPAIGPEIIVNPRELEPTGWGPDNLQLYQTGHTNNMPTNPGAEQGMGVGPERRWAHYPHVEQPNPFRDVIAMRRNGGDTYGAVVYRPETAAYWAQSFRAEQAAAAVKQRGPVNPVANQAPSVPFVSTVPPIMPGGY